MGEIRLRRSHQSGIQSLSLSSPFRTIWPTEDRFVEVIDQRFLPHEWVVVKLHTYQEAEAAIKDMVVRGAPLIGATAAYGVYLAAKTCVEENRNQDFMDQAFEALANSRPTAVNLFWALNRMKARLEGAEDLVQTAWEEAQAIVEQDVETCRLIGVHGLPILKEIAAKKPGQRINILTHCNAGMLGCIEWGTVTSPIYQAKRMGLDVHVYVDETRPRNQGANLTAYELTRHGLPHTLIVDNAGGHLMQHGMVDMVIVGTDRTTRHGDVANKIGTYLKALAAFDNKIPFYVALPSTTLDLSVRDGLKEIPIEERNQDEVRYVIGKSAAGAIEPVLICPETTQAVNHGFDVTPARLVTGLITERGICAPNEAAILAMFGDLEK